MVSLFLTIFIKIFTALLSVTDTIFTIDNSFIQNIAEMAGRVMNTISLYAPETISTLQSLVGKFIVLFTIYALFSITQKSIQIFIPNPMIKSDN